MVGFELGTPNVGGDLSAKCITVSADDHARKC